MNAPKERAADFIIFATIQACAAERFGCERNECCRNLKLALHQYWQNKILRQHGQVHKANMPRSVAASQAKESECVVEHAVPQMFIVKKLMDMNPITQAGVIELLERLFRVAIVTKSEHELLNSKGLRSTMPDDWDGIDPWARYREVGIKIAPH